MKLHPSSFLTHKFKLLVGILGRSELDDKRLQTRLSRLARNFFANPQASIPATCQAKPGNCWQGVKQGVKSTFGFFVKHVTSEV